MQRFQDLLTQAAQLKEQQLKQERKNFEALPEYLKSGLNYAKKYTQLRKQHYLVQQYISQKLKKQGNDQYMLQNYSQALSKYQEALSIFRYIHATKYENLKDEDIMYENYKIEEKYKQKHEEHLVALYLNICSALTKMNKKEEAVHASEEALKINDQNPKIFYKKAQAYLQYINRDKNDIKLGFYYLNKAYELSKDQLILGQMHKIKKQLDEERQKQKNWFKFMFDRSGEKTQEDVKKGYSNNKETKVAMIIKDGEEGGRKKIEESSNNNRNSDQEYTKRTGDYDTKSRKLKQQLERFHEQNSTRQKNKSITIEQQQNLQLTKLSLKPYLIIPRDDRWIIKYQQDFIHKHGSKIYSILQLSSKNDLLIQFKSLLAKCLELKQGKITPERDQTKLLEEKIVMYGRFIDWVRANCLQGNFRKYLERYDIQTEWIKSKRGLPIDQVYTKEELQGKTNKTCYNLNSSKSVQQKQQPKQQQQNNKLKAEQFINQVRKNTSNKVKQQQKQQQKRKKVKDEKINTGFKQQWEYELEKQQQEQKVNSNKNKIATKDKNKKQFSLKQDDVPSEIKAYLQNYENFPIFSHQDESNPPDSQKQTVKQHHNISQQQQQQVKHQDNTWSFFKTFIIIIVLVLLFKMIF